MDTVHVEDYSMQTNNCQREHICNQLPVHESSLRWLFQDHPLSNIQYPTKQNMFSRDNETKLYFLI